MTPRMTDNLLKAAFFFAVLMVLLFQSLFSSAGPAEGRPDMRYRESPGDAESSLSPQPVRQLTFHPYHDALRK